MLVLGFIWGFYRWFNDVIVNYFEWLDLGFTVDALVAKNNDCVLGLELSFIWGFFSGSDVIVNEFDLRNELDKMCGKF